MKFSCKSDGFKFEIFLAKINYFAFNFLGAKYFGCENFEITDTQHDLQTNLFGNK